MTDSRGSSARGSPYASDDESMDRLSGRGKRIKKVGSLDLDQEESKLRKMQQESHNSVSGISELKNRAQANTRKIHEMQLQFEEARVRIDKLISLRSRRMSEFDIVSIGKHSSATSVKSSSSSINVGVKSKASFAPVSLNVNVASDEDC